MLVERTRIPIGNLEDPQFSSYVNKLKLENHSGPKEDLENLDSALDVIRTLYEAKDYKPVIKGFNQIIDSCTPLLMNSLKKSRQENTPLSGDQEKFAYALCQAASDASRSCQEASNQEGLNDKEKDKTVALASFFVKKQIDFGTAMGDDLITIKALGNSVLINFFRALRLAYLEGDKEETEAERKQKARNIIINEIRSVASHFEFAKLVLQTGNHIQIEYKSALNGIKKTPDGKLAHLQFVANTLNRWGVLHMTLAEMHDKLDDPIKQIELARNVLEEAERYHLTQVENGTPSDKFLKIKFAIESNYAYTYILEANIANNPNSIKIETLSGIMSNIHNHFINNFLNPIQALRNRTDISTKEAEDIRKHFTMESITRSIETLKLMFLANTSRSTTTNPAYENLEKTVFTGILAYANNLSSSDSYAMALSKIVENEYSILNKRDFIKQLMFQLIGTGEMYLKQKKASTDDEDKICFDRTKKTLLSMDLL